MVKSLLRKTMKQTKESPLSFDGYGHYGENNGPIDDWIKRNAVDDPCDEMMPISKTKDKDYEC